MTRGAEEWCKRGRLTTAKKKEKATVFILHYNTIDTIILLYYCTVCTEGIQRNGGFGPEYYYHTTAAVVLLYQHSQILPRVSHGRSTRKPSLPTTRVRRCRLQNARALSNIRDVNSTIMLWTDAHERIETSRWEVGYRSRRGICSTTELW